MEDPRDKISLYLYDELSAAERDRVEAEIETSADFEAAVESERRFLEGLSARRDVKPPDALLAECRQDLMRAVYHEQPPAAPTWLQSFFGMFGGAGMAWQPIGALALIAIGFFGGRSWNQGQPETLAPAPLAANDSFRNVQSVEMDPSRGQVRIVLDERRTIEGSPNDPMISGLLISSSQSPNSGLRLESLDVLRRHSENRDVRQALIAALITDQNPGVRLKALEALAAHRRDPEVRQALVATLQSDGNAGIRVQAIDLLTAEPDRALVGILQELVQHETNNYIRFVSEQTLHDLNASVDHY